MLTLLSVSFLEVLQEFLSFAPRTHTISTVNLSTLNPFVKTVSVFRTPGLPYHEALCADGDRKLMSEGEVAFRLSTTSKLYDVDIC